MIFKQFNVEGCLSYIAACSDEHAGIVVDPSHDVEPYLAFIKENRLRILFCIDTHSHVDHVSLAPELAAVLDAKTVMDKYTPLQRKIGADVKELFGIEKIIAENGTKRVDIFLDDNDRLAFGRLSLKALHTPGHTQDCMCLLLHDRILSGDTLLIGQCGRTDLPGGSSEEMYRSLFHILAPLSDDLILYPAHDYKGNVNSTLGYEKRNNICLKTRRTKEEFARFLKGLFPPISMDGGKLQCGLSGDQDAGKESDAQLGSLMKGFCISMESFLATPHEWTFMSTDELAAKIRKGDGPFIVDVREPA